jgi:Gluconate 2-dehydrogenase subunit 3
MSLETSADQTIRDEERAPREADLNRREALKTIAAGVGAVGTLPLFEATVRSQQKRTDPEMAMDSSPQGVEKPRFFTPTELATVTVIAELIIPADEHSPGATASSVPAFIDNMISESAEETQAFWRDGLAAVERLSHELFGNIFTAVNPEQQANLLKSLARNERQPKTIADRFFIAIKSMTVDGYYTSEIGIQQELRYKGNTYMREFIGCTHPEHMG